MVTKLKLVGAKRYVDARISNTAAVLFGQVVEIKDPDIAAQLLEVTFINKYNEPAAMFQEVKAEKEQKEDAPKARRKPARRATIE
jgi:hypothetical protein